ncbi:MAG TPA: tetraacyldisaccharide 4'-kinase [Candidatus Acidoferrum sp.]|nr:tetraacyldisaccharide 4'-kinase [Candidatus Acidoferrum sp.]
MNDHPFLRALLWPLSLIYGAVARIRVWIYQKGWLKQKRLKGTVISVGNLTVGGTGKTPMVLWLAEKFLAEGKRVAILSRGYGGSKGTSDEVELMKHRLGNRVLFGVGSDRFRSGAALESKKPIDVFVLDDGFQHLRLTRDLNILMLDGSVKLKDERLLPSGALREPISACRRADIIVVTRKTERPDIEAKDSHKFSIFYAQTRLHGFRLVVNQQTPNYLSEIGAGPFFAFCGIGNSNAFWNDLKRWHVPLAGTKEFRDHHRYTNGDVQRLEKAAEQAGAKAFITTEKDEQNLGKPLVFKRPVYFAVIDFVFSSESELHSAIDRVLAARQGAAA